MANGYIPPGGMLGALSNTQAGQAALMGRSGGNGSRRTRRKSKMKMAASRKKKYKARSNGGGKMKAGSAAAKAWGRKMKRLRKR